ncbi:MAG TPA: Asp-tRNA(Asn)/Glu-tRNA(Gln) amidotransferase subunit GatC [Candidatus Kaiserbacteria bacterium]|nr:Asp-tRNA(Asn)/Glu-tRNA(Gln) amidotransferase subunit GatC [Candidatus Kaiserbacteria bacterium]
MASAKDIRHLAELSRLSVSDENLPRLAKELDGIIAYVGQLNELTIDVDKTPSVPLLHNVFRDDCYKKQDGVDTEEIIKAFPKRKGNSLSVKQILSHEEGK